MFSDAQHVLTLSSPAFGHHRVIVTDLHGTEAISSPYHFQLEAFSNTDNIDIAAAIGQAITIEITPPGSASRIINGLIAPAEIGHKTAADYVAYYFTVAPWFWFLRYTHNYQRFENKTAVEIFSAVCHQLGFRHFDTTKLTNTYAPIPYQLQHNESAFDFLSRVLAENTIYYRFVQTQDTHTMELFDRFEQKCQPQTLSYGVAESPASHIHHWVRRTKLVSQQVASTAYDYQTPKEDYLLSLQDRNGTPILGQSSFEQFTYPGAYPSASHDLNQGKTQLQHRLQHIVADKSIVHASSHNPSLTAGTHFSLDNHPNAAENKHYSVLSVTHTAHDQSYLPTQHDGDTVPQHYSNDFTCVNTAVSLLPNIASQPVRATGSQAATIEGPTLGTLHSESLGRVKATFFWQHDNDTLPTTHWQRVLQPIAGKNWGMQFLPRVGDEVLVRYLHGDPNQPLIIGCLHNAARLPYYQLPNEQNKSGFVSRTVGSTDTSKSHELTFDDTKNKELLRLASSNDMDFSVNKNMSVKVANTLTHQVTGNVTITTNESYVLQAKKSINLNASGSGIRITPDAIEIRAANILLGDSGAANTTLTSAVADFVVAHPTSLPATTKTVATKTINYWLATSYLNLKHPYTPSEQGLTFSTRNNSQQDPQTIQHFNGHLNKHGIGGSQVPQTEKITHVELGHSAVIGLNGKSTGYPMTSRQFSASEWQAAKAKDLPVAILAPGDQQLKADILFPAIVKNLREDAPKGTDFLPTAEEIAYFKQNGNNITVFIHGYNVPFGAFPNAINNIDLIKEMAHFESAPQAVPDISYSNSQRSYYCDMNLIKQCYPAAAKVLDSIDTQLPKALQSSDDASKDFINGEAAHNWFIRMEDSLNRATNQFDRSDYSKYTRCLHVAWSGDWGTLNYVTATKHADKASVKLVSLLRHLHENNISINIIAHSLGNRVLLGALEQLGQTAPESIDHIFMWEPAVSELALSNTPMQDNSLIAHYFPNAMQAVQKVTVLYNQYDTILAVPYWLASYFGIDLGDKINALVDTVLPKLPLVFEEDFLLSMTSESLFIENTINDFKDGLIKTYPHLQQRLRSVLYDKDCNKMLYHWIKAFVVDSKDADVRKNMNVAHPILRRYAEQFGCAQALGFVALENNFTLQQQLGKKYIAANMSKWATGHSYMHVPSEKVMIHGYQTYIMNKNYQGINSFGTYSKASFPNYKATTDGITTDTQEQGQFKNVKA